MHLGGQEFQRRDMRSACRQGWAWCCYVHSSGRGLSMSTFGAVQGGGRLAGAGVRSAQRVAAAFEGPAEGDLIGVFEVAADRQAGRQPGDSDPD